MSRVRDMLIEVLRDKPIEEVVELLYATRAMDDILAQRVVVLNTLFDLAASRTDSTASIVLDITVRHSVSRSYIWKRLDEVIDPSASTKCGRTGD